MYASPANEHWYVTAANGPRRAVLVGPFDNHSDAAKWIETTRRYVQVTYQKDIYAIFAEFGVSRHITDSPRPGRLNGRVGYAEV